MTITTDPTTVPAEVVETIAALDPERGLHIGGRGVAAASGRTFEVHDPASGSVLATVADGAAADATAAVDAADATFAAWAATPPRQRGEALRRAFELMVARAEPLAALISAENGKSLADARAEVAYAAEFFRWFSEEAVRPDGGYAESPAGGTRTIVTARPVGVAALVTPWNFPAAMATRKIAPALAAGCTVVLKPAAETPLTANAVVRILEEAGVPAGVVNVVHSTDPGDVVGTWLADPRVRKLSFTGSTGVGRHLLGQAADRVVSSSMELGGNAPFVVAADADVDAAVTGAMIAKFRNGGQACTAANRFYVHADVAAEFVDRFGAAIEALVVGSAFEPGTAIGPLISAKALDGLRAKVEDALSRGARVSHQASYDGTVGHFFPPTLLVDVPADAELVCTEAFGPVAPVVTWTDEADLLRQVNGSELGLAAYVYSGDLRWALRLAERMDAGMVGVNRGVVSDPAAPFGGVKQSGVGREGAREGVRAFTETQYFSVDWS
ncbi:NAD-dependent succinate-semialdehyde dehydrogenase [Nocardioides gansuensis]|uniref:NAD-dependent succinate-semialdehyde dehydrogenase n=1 Tax=Nocardioides gansuensis TaxID=2138300 RepID=A0A2T8F8D3_9ACTN|nr:NAD-dependent succinate-semialdehyde dehydrogenase [Nocardioides gansuensis]PVG81927.1 NAD-dependent succinate-semialdehyde dehydrogenase [Nocardioides gansuensis]